MILFKALINSFSGHSNFCGADAARISIISDAFAFESVENNSEPRRDFNEICSGSGDLNNKAARHAPLIVSGLHSPDLRISSE